MRKRKPLFMRWWLWAIVIFLFLFSLGSDNKGKEAGQSRKIGEVSQTQEKEPEETRAESQTEAQTEDHSEAQLEGQADAQPEDQTEAPAEVQTVYYVGDILHDGKMDIVYMKSGEYRESNEFLQPPDGKKYIYLQFAFENTSDSGDSSISFYSFDCYADGYACDAYYGGTEDLSATLSPGRSTSGYVYFTVPADASEIEVEYDTNMFSADKITFVYEGEKDSGYVLEGSARATEGALKVGETAESSQLRINYLNCFEDHSDNMFSQPKDGYRFITCEFEFENLTESNQIVSAIEFDCYADGISCDYAYIRNDSLSATISSGRRAKGTVTFEVPLNAAVVEVEYPTNYWTSKRVVFSALP